MYNSIYSSGHSIFLNDPTIGIQDRYTRKKEEGGRVEELALPDSIDRVQQQEHKKKKKKKKGENS